MNSAQLSGTNFTYTANFDGATMEPGEPDIGANNTVWMSWTAPTNGYAQVVLAAAPQFQHYAIYTGTSVNQLQPVSLVNQYYNNNYRFIVSAGTTYHFQFAGGADNFTFSFNFTPWVFAPNDNFSNAIVASGNNPMLPPQCFNEATMQLNEPLHLGDVPQKSLWWVWPAPVYGSAYVYPYGSLSTNFVLAVYTGQSVDTLNLVAKTTNAILQLGVNGGERYYIAAAVPTNELGDIALRMQIVGDSSVHVVPGNLLKEPSWEGTGIEGAVYWHWSGSIGGYVNEPNGVDGSTWPVLGGGTALWQSFTTIPGHSYRVRFAYALANAGAVDITTAWDGNTLGHASDPDSEPFWHWATFVTTASNTTSTIRFSNNNGSAAMDAFSVVDITAPPSIVSQPRSISSVNGGVASFTAGVTGTPPFAYQWFFNDLPLAGQTNQMLTLAPLTAAQSGNYQLIVTNAFGAVTSTVAALAVNSAGDATILAQPFGDTIPVGGYFDFSVVAAGSPPLQYQWFFAGQSIAGATNSSLMLTNVQVTNAGAYTVQVQNNSSAVMSLPATLVVSQDNIGGRVITFRNRTFFNGVTNIDAPIFDIDGVTPLNGSGYVAQLYAGPSLDLLRPAGPPTPFQSGYNAGYFVPQALTLPNVMPGSNAVCQFCAWDASYGTSYEQARSSGGRVGKSAILQAPPGNGMPFPSFLVLQSFALQAGLPYFEVGSISFVTNQPPNVLVWALTGQADSVYLIERTTSGSTLNWQPFVVLTNVSGTVTFTDTNASQTVTLYRARILD